uniref:protein-serine/threonine phosphatase n=1 Tax=Setaria italica TaxID=4555 RepID=K3YDL9_SETIT
MALSVPVTAKTTESGENGRLAYAVSAMQGFRENMEDSHTAVLQLDAATATSFFGVYDGHGGPAVSRYCGKHLHVELRKHPQFHRYPITALEETFLRMDEMMRRRKAGKELSGYGGNEYWDEYREALRGRRFCLPFCGQKLPYSGPLQDGCTACVVLIRGNEIIVGNAGDLSYKNDDSLPAIEQAITALPEVRTEHITHDAQFLILACDGIWDCMTSQQAVDYVRIYLAANAGLTFICESLLDHCVALPRGRDNMTVMLVRFKTPGAGQASSSNVLPPPPPPLPPAIVPPAGGHGDQVPPEAAGGHGDQMLPAAAAGHGDQVLPAAAAGHGDQVPPAAAAEGEASCLQSQMVPLSMRTQKEPTSTSSDPPTPNWGSAADGLPPPPVRIPGESRTKSSQNSAEGSKNSEL